MNMDLYNSSARCCMPGKALNYDIMGELKTTDRNPHTHVGKKLTKAYDDAVSETITYQPLVVPTDPHISPDAEFRSTRLIRPIHIVGKTFVDKLQSDVQAEKCTRRQIHFPNYLARLGHVGSYQWPDKYSTSTTCELGKVDYFGGFKNQHNTQTSYDAIHHMTCPDNPYKYMYNLHREDRRHAKKTGLSINEEEMLRLSPGILTNSIYGRWHKAVYPNERYHRIHSHSSFYRNRGPDAISHQCLY